MQDKVSKTFKQFHDILGRFYVHKHGRPIQSTIRNSLSAAEWFGLWTWSKQIFFPWKFLNTQDSVVLFLSNFVPTATYIVSSSIPPPPPIFVHTQMTKWYIQFPRYEIDDFDWSDFWSILILARGVSHPLRWLSWSLFQQGIHNLVQVFVFGS